MVAIMPRGGWLTLMVWSVRHAVFKGVAGGSVGFSSQSYGPELGGIFVLP
jgi:hypothetical protein